MSHLRRLLLTIVAVGLTSTSLTSAAQAEAPSQKKAMWGPVVVDGKSQFPAYRDLGVGIYQYALTWSDVATNRPASARNPADPAYSWPADLDLAVSEAQREGIRVAVRIWQTPPWANGGKPTGVTPTRTSDFTDFLTAMRRRYPSIHLWEIGAEPNLTGNLDLTPSYLPGQTVPSDAPLTARQRGQIRRYGTLVDAAYGTLKAASKRNLVVGGDVTSCGSVSPKRFMQGMRLANGRPPRMDLFGMNPYSARAPNFGQPPLGVGCSDFANLRAIHDWTGRYLARDRAKTPLRIFISEYTHATSVPTYLFGWHVTPAVQARYIRDALRIVRRTPWIYTFGWYSFEDLPLRPDGGEARHGLVTRDLVKKPGYYAYKRG